MAGSGSSTRHATTSWTILWRSRSISPRNSRCARARRSAPRARTASPDRLPAASQHGCLQQVLPRQRHGLSRNGIRGRDAARLARRRAGTSRGPGAGAGGDASAAAGDRVVVAGLGAECLGAFGRAGRQAQQYRNHAVAEQGHVTCEVSIGSFMGSPLGGGRRSAAFPRQWPIVPGDPNPSCVARRIFSGQPLFSVANGSRAGLAACPVERRPPYASGPARLAYRAPGRTRPRSLDVLEGGRVQ